MSAAGEFLKEKHVEYIKNLDSKLSQKSYEYWLSEHLRMNGLYWAITALVTMNSLEALPEEDVIEFILSCWNPRTGGFGSFPKHDAHITSTLSAIQILSIYNKLDVLEHRKERVVNFIKNLQLPDGSFQGDEFGEIDTRFVYIGLSALSIFGELTTEISDPAVAFILECENFDGGFGMVPGAESHAAQVFTCLAALAIAKKLHLVNKDKIGTWLSERQVLPSGGLNGRPEKLPDVCYSWWVLSSLAIIERDHWIDPNMLTSFILTCQDPEEGGFGDRPENQTDVYHTCFSIAGLSLMGRFDLLPIDPRYCMPSNVTKNFRGYLNINS